jgi:hypothetical protein
MKEKIMKWYPRLWSIDMVQMAVIKNVITAQEYKEITGEDFPGYQEVSD